MIGGAILKNLIIWGGGKVGKTFINNALMEIQHEYETIVVYDSDSSKWNSNLENITIVDKNVFEDLAAKDTDIIICTNYWKDIFSRTG